jgi:UDP-glucose 4-epimerase
MVAKYVKGAEVEYIIDPSRKGELKLDGVAISNKKAKSELGWDLAVSLEEGIRQTVEWYQKECLNGDNANES